MLTTGAFPRKEINQVATLQTVTKIPASNSSVVSQSIRVQVAANEYLDRAGISSHAVWQNCVVFFLFDST